MKHKRLWILNRGKIGNIILGPTVRSMEMAKMALKQGYEVHLCMDACESSLPNGITFHRLCPELIRKIPIGDRIVTTIFLTIKELFTLLFSKKTFDVDFYCVGALEALESDSMQPDWRLYQGRRRTRRRYKLLIENSRKIYISNYEQIAFLGGVLFSFGDANSSKLASQLPERCVLLPMGVRPPYNGKLENPYPPEIQSKKIVLWGGGIWAWFDIETLLMAFAEINKSNKEIVLFFLSGTNNSGMKSQTPPVEFAKQRASDLGIEGINVFFHQEGVSPDQLPSFLHFCCCGVMANPARLESYGSWRTRLLDLIWMDKATITSGYDPLSSAMEAHNVAWLSPTGNHKLLAETIQKFTAENRHKKIDCSQLKKSFAWEGILAEWMSEIQEWPETRSSESSRLQFVLYMAGV